MLVRAHRARAKNFWATQPLATTWRCAKRSPPCSVLSAPCEGAHVGRQVRLARQLNRDCHCREPRSIRRMLGGNDQRQKCNDAVSFKTNHIPDSHLFKAASFHRHLPSKWSLSFQATADFRITYLPNHHTFSYIALSWTPKSTSSLVFLSVKEERSCPQQIRAPEAPKLRSPSRPQPPCARIPHHNTNS